jgi:hypothetical protein
MIFSLRDGHLTVPESNVTFTKGLNDLWKHFEANTYELVCVFQNAVLVRVTPPDNPEATVMSVLMSSKRSYGFDITRRRNAYKFRLLLQSAGQFNIRRVRMEELLLGQQLGSPIGISVMPARIPISSFVVREYIPYLNDKILWVR